MPSKSSIDLVGNEFGRLTVKRRLPAVKGRAMWECVCSCGNVAVVRTSSLTSGNTKSCGCINKECTWIKKHGLSVVREYFIWNHMKTRCYNPNIACYHNYGGRGITVCDRWRDSFEAFYEDMGPRPTKKHSLDRIDVNGNYEPGNCRWATFKEQARNRRNNRLIMFKGKERSLAEIAEDVGILPLTLAQRLDRGMSIQEAIDAPIGRYFEINGVSKTSSEWARQHGLSVRTVNRRLEVGKSIEEALGLCQVPH